MKPSGLTFEQELMIRDVDNMLRYLETDNVLPAAKRNQIYTCMAYEMLLIDWEERAVEILKMADPEYFKEDLKADMKEDPDFTIIVQGIASKLIEIGLVKVSLV